MGVKHANPSKHSTSVNKASCSPLVHYNSYQNAFKKPKSMVRNKNMDALPTNESFPIIIERSMHIYHYVKFANFLVT